MFSSIRIQDFRSCSDVTLDDIDDILVLIGRNGAGKTNVLRAIEWACFVASHPFEGKTSKADTRMATQTGKVELKFKIAGAEYFYGLTKTMHISTEDPLGRLRWTLAEEVKIIKDGIDIPIIRRNGESITLLSHTGKKTTRSIDVSRSVPCLIAIQSLLKEDDYFRGVAECLISFLSNVKYYSLHNYEDEATQGYILGSQYAKWLSDKQSRPQFIVSLKIIDLYLNRREKYEELKSLLGNRGLGIIEDISVDIHHLSHQKSMLDDDSEKVFILYFKPSGYLKRDPHIPFEDLSFGTKRIIFLFVAMLYDKSSVSLLEQPEDGIHAGLADKLIPLFRAYTQEEKSQFIIATHSTAILNRINPIEVRLLSIDQNGTDARALSEIELDAANEYMSEDGPLSDFLESIEE